MLPAGLLCFLVWASGDELLIDSARDVLSWGTDNGGEFPGATAGISIVEDPERGPCVRGEFAFGGDSRYAGVKWHGRLPDAKGLGFWVKIMDRDRGIIRVRDATDQEHLAGFTAARGEWTRVHVPLAPETFGNHWGGVNDGVLHFPLKAVLLAVNRGPDVGEMRVSNLFADVDELPASARWKAVIKPGVPSGVALSGEPAEYSVQCINQANQRGRCRLVVTSQAAGQETAKLFARDIELDGWDHETIRMWLPTNALGYWRLRARILDLTGAELSQTVSGLAVVPRPRHYGEAAPDCYFGMQHIPDLEAAERLGVKAVRVAPGWRWAEPRQGEVRWEAYLDPIIESNEKHHMQMLFTAQSIAPSWIAWKRDDNPKVAGLPDPARLHEWERFVRDIAARYRGKIAAIEIQNEPDLTCAWQPGLPFEEGVAYYAELLRRGWVGAKAGDPDVDVAGIDVSGGDFRNSLKFTRGVLDEAASTMNLYTGHPYSSPRYFGPGLHPKWPIANRVPEKCAEALDAMAEYGRPRRMWIGELGWGLQQDADPLSEYSIDFAACIAQSLIAGKSVPGVEKYLHFTLAGCNEDGYEYGVTRGHPAYPLPAAIAYATCAYVLDGGRPVERRQVSADLWRASFANEDRGELLVAWFSTGDAVSVKPTADAPRGEWIDSYMHSIEPTPAGITVGRLPVYWVLPLNSTGLRPAFLDQMQMAAPVPVKLERVFRSRIDALGLLLANRTNTDQTVTVQTGNDRHTVTVPVGDETVRRDVPLPPDAPASTAISVSCGDVSTPVKPMLPFQPLSGPPGGLTVDGDLSEWQGAAQFGLSQREHVLPPDPGIGWSGPEDLTLTAYLAADSEALYFAASVTDDVHSASSTGPGNFWNSDSIQLAVDPLNDSGDEFDSNDREVGFVLAPEGGLGFITSPGPFRVGAFPVSVTRERARTVYEAVIPWEALDTRPPTPGDIIAVNFIANDNDGEGRNYWMGLTPGIGEGKSPISYRQFAITAGE